MNTEEVFQEDKGGLIVDNEKWSVDTENNMVNSSSDIENNIVDSSSDMENTNDTNSTDNTSYTVHSDNSETGFVTTMNTESENNAYGQYRREYYSNNLESEGRTNRASTGTYTNAETSEERTGSRTGSNTAYTRTTDVQRSAYDRTVGNKEFHTENKKVTPKKKKKGLLKKAACLVLAAVVFGGVAGGTIVGINYAAQQAGVIASNNVSSSTGESRQQATLTNSEVKSTSTSSNTETLDVSGIVEDVLPAIVAITNTQIYEDYTQNYDDWYRYFFGNGGNRSGSNDSDSSQEYDAGSGSGIIVSQTDDELLIVTNNHVIEDADSLTVTFADDSTAKAQIKGADSNTDLAVIAVQMTDISSDTKSAIKVASLGDSDQSKVGEGVIAIGNALGYGQSVTVGYISALNRTIQTSDSTTLTMLQTDAAINPGNSGGALINMHGEVIGINSAKYSDTDVEGMGYAIPISLVKDQIDTMMNQKTKVELDEDEQGYLGIYGASIDRNTASIYGIPTGVLISSIVEGSPADNSDLKEKDVITKFDGQTVSTQQDISDLLKYYAGGTEVELTVQTLQDGQYVEHVVTVTLGYAKDKPDNSMNSNSNRQ